MNRLEELSRLQQTSSLSDYLDKFEELLNDVDDQSESALITYFVGGLRADLRSEMKILNLKTLRQDFAAVKVYEAHPGRRHLPWRTPYQLPTRSPSADPLLKAPSNTSKAVPIVRKTMTLEEHRARTTKDLCFNCDDTYSPGHRCKG